MIEKIQMSDAEKKLQNGVPANIRALDSMGNSILSTISEVAKSIGIYSIRDTFEPLEEYEIKIVSGCLILAQLASSQHEIGVAIMYGNLGGVILNDVSGVSFFKQNEVLLAYIEKK